MRSDFLRFNGAVEHDPAIDAWLKKRDGELGAIARQWFAVMRKCGDEVRELLHDGCPTACLGDAPFAYVNVFTSHVNVGFFHGASLPDPGGWPGIRIETKLTSEGKAGYHCGMLAGSIERWRVPQVRFGNLGLVLGLRFALGRSLLAELAMPTGLQRYYGKGDLHFITFSCYQRMPLLKSARAREVFVRELARVRDEMSFRLLGYVVMPEHDSFGLESLKASWYLGKVRSRRQQVRAKGQAHCQ